MVSKKNVFSIWLVILFSFCLQPFESNAALVAHWTFDEGSGTQVVDTVSGIIGNLSATGASLESGGMAGGALSLSKASSGYVTMGDVLRLGSGPYSFVVWVKTSSTEATTVVIAKQQEGIPNGYHISINENGAYGLPGKAWLYNHFPANSPVSTTSVNDGLWHQIVGVRGNNQVKIYVDGFPVEGSQPDQGLDNSIPGTPFLVGGYPFGGNPVGTYTGLIDDIQVYNHDLSDGEVQWLFDHPGETPCTPPPSGLVSWWGGENNALDLAGTNNGALMNEATYGTGRVGQAFSLDGVDDYISVPDSPSLNPSTITVNAWILSNNSPGTYAPPIVQKIDFRGYTLELTTDSSQVKFWVKLEKTNPVWTNWIGSPGGNLTPGIWTHVAGVYDGMAVSLYMNGQLIGSTSEVASIVHSTSALNIGRNSYETTRPFFKGLIDEVGIFNRALSPEEIAAIYNAGSAGQCPIRRVLTVTPSGTGSGSVTGNGLNCSWNGSSSETCSVSLAHNTAVSLTASPSAGSAFSDWSGGSGSATGCSGTGACAFTISQASSVGPIFIQKSSIYLPLILRP